tara:strand:- start:1845 stop:2318 length:474 start_codon:yes stop_codon:yes gene_type:complete
MIEQISAFFTIQMIYLWVNIGVLPFWLILLFFPQSKICNFFVTSVFPIILMSSIYIYLIYKFSFSGYDFSEVFTLYLGANELRSLFNETSFLIIFWVHFVSINLFCGSWITRDSQKYIIPKFLIFFPLIFTYFIGPVGISVYWLIKIFFAKKISLYE